VTAADGTDLGAGASRPASLVVGVVVAVALTLVIGSGGESGTGVGVGLTATAGAILGVAVLCRERDTPAWTAVASLLTPLAAVVGVTGAVRLAAASGALTTREPSSLLAALGLAVGAGIAALGAVGTLGDGIGDGAVSRTWRTAAASTTVVTVAFGVVLVGRGDVPEPPSIPGIDAGALLDPALSPTDPTVGLASFLLLVAAAAFAGRVALSTLPVVELAHRRRREAVRAAVQRVDATLRTAGTYGFLAAVASGTTAVPPVREALPVATVATVVGSTTLRSALLTATVVAGGVALGGRLLRAAAGETASTLGRVLPTTAGGVGVVLVAAAVGGGGGGGGGRLVRSLVADLPAGARSLATGLLAALSPAGVLLGGALAALTALAGVLVGLVVAGAVGLLPARGSGGVLAGAGLGSVAVLLGARGASAPVTFALVGLAVVAWDVSDRGVEARADLGPRSATRIEAVHAVASVGVAALGVGAAWGLSGAVGAVALPDGALVGAVAAVAAAVGLLAVLRG
jgi:hypothetical protein